MFGSGATVSGCTLVVHTICHVFRDGDTLVIAVLLRTAGTFVNLVGLAHRADAHFLVYNIHASAPAEKSQ